MTVFVVGAALLLGIAVGAAVLGMIRWWVDCQRMRSMVFLQVLMPKKESKEDKEIESEQFSATRDFREVVGVMDHLFQSLYATYNHRLYRLLWGQPFFSIEYAGLEGETLFFLVVPHRLVSLIEKQVTSFYPDAVVDIVEDYDIFTPQSFTASAYLLPTRPYYYPFRSYDALKSDPLNAIMNAFSKLSSDEGAAVQIVLRPVASGWQRKCDQEARHLLNPRHRFFSWWNPLRWVSEVFDMFTISTQTPSKEDQMTGERVSPQAEELSKALDQKAASPGFIAVIRVVTSAGTPARAQLQLENLVGSFIQFNAIRGNGLRHTTMHSDRKLVTGFIRRSPYRTLLQRLLSSRMILSSGELASLFHLPNIKYNKVQTIKWQNFKVAPAPKTIPSTEGPGAVFVGTNVYRGDRRSVYLRAADRFRHFYIIGQTGTGKSSILQIMARQDFHQNRGICVVDPHGSLAEDLLPYIPRSRADDVIYFNPADTERPMGLNLLEGKTEEEQDLIALDAMNMMVKMFGEEIFGPRIQDYFRNGCLTLMADEEEGGAITDLVRLFTDDEWQRYKVERVKNPIVRAFWEKQMVATGQREKQEMIPYFAAKFGQFTTNTLIRNIVGQVRSAFDFSEVMDTGKILIMNLSKGLVGDINSKLLGLIVVNKIQVASMRRQRQQDRERRDFFLYIDEFQNYVTESIETILSEARKYKLSLILAHQYLDQLHQENKLSKNVDLKGAVFGNVGTVMAYKVGPQDGEFLAKQFSPVFSEQDLINIDAFKACIRLSVDGQPSRPFTLDVPKPWLDVTYPRDDEAAEAFKQLSRLKYGRDKQFVSREIVRRIGAFGSGAPAPALTPSPLPA